MKQMIPLLVFILLWAITVNAQVVVLDEDFEDRDLTQNPEWTGDLNDFSFTTENGNTLLQLDAESTPSRTQIRTRSSAAYGSWEFFFRQPAYSTQNRIYVFLIADREDLNRLDGSRVNGYAIHTGSGRIDLVRVDGGNDTVILSADTELQVNTGYQVKAERDENGEWQLSVSEGYGSTPEIDSGTVVDDTYAASTYFGLFLRYSAGNVANYFFDDIRIESTEEFAATAAQVSGSSSVDVTFNYLVEESSLPGSEFTIDGGIGNPQSITLVTDFTVRLSYPFMIPEGDYLLTISGVESGFGTTIQPGFEVPFSFQNPFFIESAVVIDNRTIDIMFSETVDENSLSPPSNFLLNGAIVPGEVTRPEPQTARLLFGEPLASGAHEIELNNLDSESGFSIPNGTLITAFHFDEAEPGDIVINEFFYRVPIEWRTAEFDRPRYIELQNTSDKFINLQNWSFNNQLFWSEGDLAIEPGEFAVITRGEPVFTDHFGDRGYIEADNFPTLPLTTENEIVLRNPVGVVIDSLYYIASSWGGNGVALERRDAGVAAHFRENWGESPNPLLGTPGIVNEVQPDTEPPVWQTLFASGSTEFLLEFNKRIDEHSAVNPESFSINPSLPVTEIIHDINKIRILIGEKLVNNRVYEITIHGITDIFGNAIESETRTVTYLEFSDPEPQQLVINEILFRRLQTGSEQFVEIYNRTGENFDLSGWTLSDATGSAVIPAGTALPAHNYIVFTGDEAFASGSDKIVRLHGFRSYNTNSGDAVILRDNRGTTIDSLFYRPSWGSSVPGVSLERKDPGALSIDPANWAASTAEGGSTPAAENSVFEIDETAPQIIFANLFHPDSLEVRFSEFTDLLNMQQAAGRRAGSANPDTRFMANGSELNLISYNPGNANRAVLDGSGLQGGTEIILRAENIMDFQGNVSSMQEHPVAQPARPGDLVFNEIMFNPLADTHDGIPDQTEYLEIINRRTYAISMEGIFIHDEPDENNEVTALVSVSSAMKWIPAESFFLFYPESGDEKFSGSGIALFFDLAEELNPHTFRFNRSTLGLTNTGRQVFLADSSGTTLDMVHYSPGWHNPNLIDTRGISLERIDPYAGTNDSSNWGSNTLAEGGTPLAVNSIFQVPSSRPSAAGIVLEPNPFSPDGDGFEDNLFINYKLGHPDYLLRVRIYDRYGRLVRNLAEAHPAGFEGSLIWDGRTDNGLRNRIGIYIVYVEAYNSAAGRNRNFRETVVIARQF